MPIQISPEQSNIVIVRLSGKLKAADYTSFVPQFKQLLEQHGKLRVLLDMTGLEGWAAGAIWPEAKFDLQYHSGIERLAMVGTKEWQHAVEALAKPFTKTTMRYFDGSDLAAARRWLDESAAD